MSRENKFRAWDEINNKWIDGCDLIMESSGRIWAGDVNNPPMIQIKSENVVFFTGLKDKNSKEIFNGDIVERNGIKYQITLEIGSFLLVKIDENTDMYEEFVDCWNDHVYPLSQLYWNNSDEENHIYDLEVIGNIYGNPELLEETA